MSKRQVVLHIWCWLDDFQAPPRRASLMCVCVRPDRPVGSLDRLSCRLALYTTTAPSCLRQDHPIIPPPLIVVVFSSPRLFPISPTLEPDPLFPEQPHTPSSPFRLMSQSLLMDKDDPMVFLQSRLTSHNVHHHRILPPYFSPGLD